MRRVELPHCRLLTMCPLELNPHLKEILKNIVDARGRELLSF